MTMRGDATLTAAATCNNCYFSLVMLLLFK